MVTMGTTKIICGLCGATAQVKNEDLEVMREHRCNNPSCNARMTDQQMADMKAEYFLGLAVKYAEAFGSGFELFDYEIDIKPEYKPDWAISAEDGS